MLAVVVVLALSGCSGGDDAPTEAVEDPFEPLPKVEQAKADVPEDRDPRAVEEALRRIDACAVAEAMRGHDPALGASAEVSRDGPHSCRLRAVGRFDGSAHVRLGESLNAEDRYAMRRIDLAGATAYSAASGDGFCEVAIPVSFEHAVMFTYSMYDLRRDVRAKRPCLAARRLVSGAVAQMRDPNRIPEPPQPARWSSCDLLAAALDERLSPKQELRFGDGIDGMDECVLQRVVSDDSLALTGASLRAVDTDFTASIHYRSDYATKKDDRIRGRSVEVVDGKTCTYSWRHWPAIKDSDSPGAVALSAPNCRRAAAMTRIAMRALDGPTRTRSKVAPQRPLLYESSEVDLPVDGACVDLNPDEWVNCRPYADADVPDDPVELIRHAEADRNVNCALAIDAVRDRYGDQLRPVTVDGFPHTGVGPARSGVCAFVDQSHAVTVWVGVSSTPLEYAAMGRSGRRVAGHAAVTDRQKGSQEFHAVALDQPDEPGQIIVGVARQPTEAGNSAESRRLIGTADALAADLVKAHF